jgi:hypothetical protein
MSDSVNALTVFDDGNGAALYAGGYFPTAGGITVNGIAKWNGASWSSLGTGMAAPLGFFPHVCAFAVFDDGSGPALYAAGYFTSAGGVFANRIAKWNGTSWSPLGMGIGAELYALSVFDDGSGPALYAGGYFGTTPLVSSIAKWDGASWSSVGIGIQAPFQIPSVYALTVFDDGSGPVLHAGGYFSVAGGQVSANWARWGQPWGDLTGDSFVELADWGLFASCWNGSGPSGCDCADTDTDGDVDLRDAAVFQRRFRPQ